jgi:hypothetical protein
MYAFSFVLVPLAIVAAWALIQDRKRRHRPRHHSADTESRIRARKEIIGKRPRPTRRRRPPAPVPQEAP